MFEVSHIFDHQIQDKILIGNRVSETATYKSLGEVAVAATVYHMCCSTFTDNIKTKDNIIQSRLISFDYDKEETTPDELELLLDGYQFLVLATQSHMKWKGDQEPCQRFRLLLPLETQVFNSESIEATYDSLEKIITMPADKCMRSGAQYMKKHLSILAASDEGKLITPVIKPKTPPPVRCMVGDLASDNDLEKLFFDLIVKNNKEAWDIIGTPGETYNNQVKIIFECKKQHIDMNYCINRMLEKVEHAPEIHQRTIACIKRIYKK